MRRAILYMMFRSRILVTGIFILLLPFSLAHADDLDDLIRAMSGLPPLENSSSSGQVPNFSDDLSDLLGESTATSSSQSSNSATSTTTTVSTISTIDREKEITVLQGLVTALTKQLQEIFARKKAEAETLVVQESAKPEGSASVVVQNPANCAPLTKNLSRGKKGSDVFCLQQVLAADGLLDPENISGFFGAVTEKALKEFQVGHGLDPRGTGFVGPKTMSEVNSLLSALVQMQGGSSSTPALQNVPEITFGPQLPVGVDPQDFVLIAGEKHEYAFKVENHSGGGFDYIVDWGDATSDTGRVKSGVIKNLTHAFAEGAQTVVIKVQNSFGANEQSFELMIDPAGGAGDMLEITSPLNAFTFDVVTLMPVSIHAKDPRVTGSVRLYLQTREDERIAGGLALGGMQLQSGADATQKFPLTEIAAGTYWLQAVGSRFQECVDGACKEFLPNHKVGPIKISDQSGFFASQAASSTAANTEAATTTLSQ